LKLTAEVARTEGDLNGAAEAYRLWNSVEPQAWEPPLSSSASRCRSRPGSLSRLSRVSLSPVQQEWVAKQLLDRMAGMEEANVVQSGESAHDEASRSARVLYEPEPVRNWFVPLVAASLPSVLPRLGLPQFKATTLELQLTASDHGDFYKVHHDITLGEEDSVAGRRVSFVYYFQLPGGSFAGGADSTTASTGKVSTHANASPACCRCRTAWFSSVAKPCMRSCWSRPAAAALRTAASP